MAQKIILLLVVMACPMAVESIPRAHGLKIVTSQSRYEINETITVTLTNMGNRDVSYCVDYQMVAPRANPKEMIPLPEFVFRHRNSRRDKWGIMTGLGERDVGSIVYLRLDLKPTESKTYMIRISQPGLYQLVLAYSNRKPPNMCDLVSKKLRKAQSRKFSVR